MNRSSLNKQTEALKLALEALEKEADGGWSPDAKSHLRKAQWLVTQLAEQQEHEQQHTRDAEAELNCAEEVLDGYAAHLELKETAFNCIGDYIKEVCEALKEQPAQQEQIDLTSVRSSGPHM